MGTKAKGTDESSPRVIPVAEGEDPWTKTELKQLRAQLQDEAEAFGQKYDIAQASLTQLFSEGTDMAGRDPADVGFSNIERDQEMSLVAHARELFEQSEMSLKLFDEGRYGVCEICDLPIGKLRLQAFPRATMCMSCKQLTERRL
ncbi:MAG: TraR/DksA C4-type zinc finger protein [Propionibacteriaceae bacterium]|jgi:DnaK suppressor protein|nr:TraR/DksA C4-type zinc finger protein [Propionibacteriaceae bacterium]